jgi:5-methyltetrahydropteroyltriglutamate--homocysteine methyltransferase
MAGLRPREPARAEIVGSLLRPPRLLAAAARVYEPGHLVMYAEERAKDRSELDRVADEEIRRAVERQIDAGLDVVSDGEFRRLHFISSFHNAVDGFESGPGRRFHNERGEEVQVAEGHVVARRLRKVDSTLAREVAFMRDLTDHPFKVTLPAASWFAAPATFRAGITDRAYASHEELLADTVAIQRQLIAEAIDAGATYIQLDFPLYPALVDRGAREQMTADGADLDRVLDLALDCDRRVVEGFPGEVRFALHICRGNFRSRWVFEGALDPLAERIFSLPYAAFLIEWEDERREGDFSALRFAPRGPLIVLGVVSSKSRRVETVDEVVARIEEAARYAPVEQLAVSPQCGFASVADGNELSEDAQWRKLEVVSAAADRVWV